jgi:predicted dehydrogenase
MAMEALEKVRIGVIGCGSIGRHHMKQIQTLENACITAACDIETNNLSKFGHEARLGNSSLYTDYSDLLKSGDVDAVVICLPNRFHAPVSIEAFEHGLHVFCEKPMAMNYEEAEKMIKASVKSGRKLQIGLQNRFRGESQALKERIDRGILGDVYYSKCGWLRRSGLPPWGSWFMRRKDSGGGPTMDIGVHVLDLAFWLMSDFSVKTVYASSYSRLASRRSRGSGVFDVEDLASALIKMENGATVMFEASWVTHIEGPRFYVELMGENAGVDYTSTTFYGMDGEKPVDEKVPYKEVNPYLEEMMHFLDCIIFDQPPLTKPDELLGLQLILDMINKSSHEDRVVYSSEYKG